MKHIVIGTAGHIDHGKSSLVLALTGTDPDRLQEEKARGITIDLGFAHTIEDGMALSFVDVPGHERFVRNMLAGVAGMDLVMLHVAADESVMPQTREHFEICRLLRVPAGLVVITKADLADPATLDVVRLEIQDLVADSFLEGAPVVAVSARTGSGVPELRRVLATMATSAPARPCHGPPRLPIDRVFSMKGFGTVVTGTLMTGAVRADDDLVLQPSGRAVKVRGLQVHGEAQLEATAGQRVAVNLAGVEVAEVMRGDTLTRPDAVTVTSRADVHVELLHSAQPLRHGARVRFHQGTRELLGRVALAGPSTVEPGTSAFARLHFEAPAVLVRGDRFILRAYSPLATMAGGTLLDPLPPRRGVRTPAAVARFTKLSETESAASAVLTMIDEAGLSGLPLTQVVGRAGVRWAERDPLVARLEGRAMRVGNVLVGTAHLAAVTEATVAMLGRYHQRHALDEGIPREELREQLFGRAAPGVFEGVLASLVDGGRIVARDRVALAGHGVVLSDEEARARAAIVQALHDAGLMPPDVRALASQIGVDPAVVDRITNLLVRRRVLVRAGDLVFDEAALARLKTDVQSLKHSGATPVLDVAAFKDRYNITRKYAIPLLEYLDRERVTRRVGDSRRIL